MRFLERKETHWSWPYNSGHFPILINQDSDVHDLLIGMKESWQSEPLSPQGIADSQVAQGARQQKLKKQLLRSWEGKIYGQLYQDADSLVKTAAFQLGSLKDDPLRLTLI